jgi:hypothetical protein
VGCAENGTTLGALVGAGAAMVAAGVGDATAAGVEVTAGVSVADGDSAGAADVGLTVGEAVLATFKDLGVLPPLEHAVSNTVRAAAVINEGRLMMSLLLRALE